jgi:hypothetical protein
MSVRLEVVVCEGPTCQERGGSALRRVLFHGRGARWNERVEVTPTICFGHCARGPNVLVCPVASDGPRMGWQGLVGPGTMLLHGVTAETVAGLDALLEVLAAHDPDAGQGT